MNVREAIEALKHLDPETRVTALTVDYAPAYDGSPENDPAFAHNHVLAVVRDAGYDVVRRSSKIELRPGIGENDIDVVQRF